MNQTLELILKDNCSKRKVSLIVEHKFHPERRWKADYYIPELSCIIEFEGGIFMPKSGHTNAKGYNANCEKYNEAQLLGLKVFRFTVMNFDKEYINQTLDLIDRIFWG